MKHSKNGGDGGTGVYMREGTTSRVMAAGRPYSEFYDVYSISPEYFGYHLIYSQRRSHCTHSLRTLVSMIAGTSLAEIGKGLRLLGNEL
jgi:hypothetical protein